jgi:hypothetical protein
MPPKKDLIDFSNPKDMNIVIDELLKNNKNMDILKVNRKKFVDVPKEDIIKLKEIKKYIDNIIGLSKAIQATPIINVDRKQVIAYYNKHKKEGVSLNDAWKHFRNKRA